MASELFSLSIDIAIITETHLKKHHSHSTFAITGYNYVRRDRDGRRGGGVTIYLKENLNYRILTPQADKAEYEPLWVQVQWNDVFVTVAALYHPPQPIYETPELKEKSIFSNRRHNI